MAVHESVVGTKIGEAPPTVPGHASDERTFLVNHLVVGQGKDEVLTEGVDQSEGHLVPTESALHAVQAHELQGVVHPAQVPLEPEPKSTVLGGARDHGPSGRLLGNGHGSRVAAVNLLVEALQKGRGLEVFVASEFVGNPFSRFAAVVQVEHGGDRVHPQSVHVIGVEPEQGVANQKIDHLGAAVVVDQGPPIHVTSLARVGVFVEMRAVEATQCMRVGGEMAGHPVDDHAQAGAVASVDQVSEAVRITEPGRGCVQTDRLISP